MTTRLSRGGSRRRRSRSRSRNNLKPTQIHRRLLRECHSCPSGRLTLALPVREEQHVNARFALGVDLEHMALGVIDHDAVAGSVAGSAVLVVVGVCPGYLPCCAELE